MVASTGFLDLVRQANRNRRLGGLPLSSAEASKIATPFFAGAASRKAQADVLKLGKEKLATSVEEARKQREFQSEEFRLGEVESAKVREADRLRQAERITSTEEMEASRLEEIRITREAQQAAAKRAEEAAEVGTGEKVAIGAGVGTAAALGASQLTFAGGLALSGIGIIGVGIILGIAAIAGK